MRTCFLFALTMLFCSAANAAPVNSAADIARVEAYLSGLITVTADFTQTEANGTVSKGKFYLQRPGKMRWQYAAPTPILIVSDGKAITYYDAELDQISYIGVDDTLAGFLAQKEIKLESATTHLTKFETTTEGSIRATLIQKAKPEEGSLTLELSDNPLQIQRMEITDATGQVARVQLMNARFGDPLDKKLFTFIDPRGSTGRHR